MSKVKSRGGFCCWCHRGPLLASTDLSGLAFTRDHVNPRARGGGRWVPCCRHCNMLKAALHPDEWFWFIDNTPRYWKLYRNSAQVERVIQAERMRRVREGEKAIVPIRVVLTDKEFEEMGIAITVSYKQERRDNERNG